MNEEVNNMANCLLCNGTGRTKDNPYKCDECGKEYELGPLLQVDNFGIYVPKEYRDELWDSEKSREGIVKKYETKAQRNEAIKWVTILENIKKSIENKKPIPGAFYVSAPNGMGKTRWQYTIQTLAGSKGYQLHPITDVIDINMGMDQSDLLTADILILRVTNYRVKDAMEKLNFILPKRRDRDLTTIIMSVLPYRYLETQIDYVSFEMDYIVELHI